MIDNQLGRRNIPDYARVELNLRKEDILKPIAKTTQGHRSDLSSSLTKSHDTRKEIAKVSKVAEGTVHKVKFIRDNANEETKKELRRGNKKLSINRVYTQLKRNSKRNSTNKK